VEDAGIVEGADGIGDALEQGHEGRAAGRGGIEAVEFVAEAGEVGDVGGDEPGFAQAGAFPALDDGEGGGGADAGVAEDEGGAEGALGLGAVPEGEAVAPGGLGGVGLDDGVEGAEPQGRGRRSTRWRPGGTSGLACFSRRKASCARVSAKPGRSRPGAIWKRQGPRDCQALPVMAGRALAGAAVLDPELHELGVFHEDAEGGHEGDDEALAAIEEAALEEIGFEKRQGGRKKRSRQRNSSPRENFSLAEMEEKRLRV
jgi:hypothetical protein